MIPVKGGYAVDVPVINVSDRARRENASVWSTFNAFGVTLRKFLSFVVSHRGIEANLEKI